MKRLVSTDEHTLSIRSSILGGGTWLKIGAVLLLVFLVGALAVMSVLPDKATSQSSAYSQSSKVALVTKSSGEVSGAGNMLTSGTVAGMGAGFSFGQFTFTDVPLSGVTSSNLANYDTVVLVQVPTGSLSGTNKQAINDFVTNGKKLIIYDSDATSGNDYSWLAAPAQTGRGCPNCGSNSGTATVLENNAMVSSDPSDSNHYINTDEVATQTDAVGDSNVMLSQSSAWF